MPPSSLGWVGTRGRAFVAGGKEVVLRGVNWFGFETETLCPHGLWQRSLDSMLNQILEPPANLLRLPFCNDIFSKGAQPSAGSINTGPGFNPALEGVTCLGLLDLVVHGCGQRGIRVLLDRHRPTSSAQSELWYNPRSRTKRRDPQRAEEGGAAAAGGGGNGDHSPREEETGYASPRDTELEWIEDWVFLARRYSDEPCVIGADLHNEPCGNCGEGHGIFTFFLLLFLVFIVVTARPWL